jgi:hypothetical protein
MQSPAKWHIGTQGDMAVSSERYVLQMPGQLAATRIRARASFLRSIFYLRPNVVVDLWETALPDFKQLVLARFFREIFDGINPESYIKERHEKCLAGSDTICDYLVDLIQQRLSPDNSFPESGDDLVREAFFSYASATNSPENKLLITKIDEWSLRWNLDEDWCRDHALAVLRKWLFDRELKWVGLFNFAQPTRIQQSGWISTVSELETEAPFSNVLVELDLESDSEFPGPLKFSPRNKRSDFSFENRWNLARESELEFKMRVRLEFRLALAEAEVSRLKTLRQQPELFRTATAREFERLITEMSLSGRNGVLESFERELQNYIANVNAWRTKAKLQYKLEEGPQPPRDEHLRWLILCRIPDKYGNCLTYSEIVETAAAFTILLWLLHPNLAQQIVFAISFLYSHIEDGSALTAEASRKNITTAAKLISLKTKNPHTHRGRPRGTGKPIALRARQ